VTPSLPKQMTRSLFVRIMWK